MYTKLDFLDRFFENKSKREVAIIFMLTIVFVWFISSSYFLPRLNGKIISLKESSGMNNEIKKPYDTEKLLQDKSMEAESLKNKLNSLKKEYATKISAIENNQMLFLDEQTLNLFINFLATNFSKNSLQIESFKSTVLPPRVQSKLGRAVVEIEFRGEFKNILYLLNYIENSSFSCAVDTLRVKKAEDQRFIKISLYGLVK